MYSLELVRRGRSKRLQAELLVGIEKIVVREKGDKNRKEGGRLGHSMEVAGLRLNTRYLDRKVAPTEGEGEALRRAPRRLRTS